MSPHTCPNTPSPTQKPHADTCSRGEAPHVPVSINTLLEFCVLSEPKAAQWTAVLVHIASFIVTSKILKVAGPTGLRALEMEMGVCVAGVLSFQMPLYVCVENKVGLA